MTLAGPATASQLALALRRIGVTVRARVGPRRRTRASYDEAFLDVWTPEVAPRVAGFVPADAVVRCLGDLVLERSRRADDRGHGHRGQDDDGGVSRIAPATAPASPVHASTTARAGEPLADGRAAAAADGRASCVMELTSSHLCFTTRSPTVAVITCFWPDHLELHGSLERYRAAKEAIVRRQGADDVVVVNEDDAQPRSRSPSALPGAAFGFSVAARCTRGAFAAGGEIVLRDAAGERSFRHPARDSTARASRRCSPRRRRRWRPARCPRALPSAAGTALPRDAASAGWARTELIDDGMAATPAKTASSLQRYARPDRSCSSRAVSSRAPASPVHASPEEQRAARARMRGGAPRRAARRPVRPCRRAARAALRPDAGRLVAATLDEAIALASSHAEGAEVLVVSPMFPLSLADRERIAPALGGVAESGNSD